MNKFLLLDEPLLEFGNGQEMIDPHDGLSLFGPSSSGASICYGVVGAKEGIRSFERFSEQLERPQMPGASAGGDEYKTRLWAPYPGFEVAFGAQWPGKAAWSCEIDRQALTLAADKSEESDRTFAVVNLYLDAIRVAAERDENFGVIICVVPDFVWKNCRVESRVPAGTGNRLSSGERKLRRLGQGDLFERVEQFQYSLDFRRQLKARAMEYGFPIQLVRESTVGFQDPAVTMRTRTLTPPSDVAWNLSTAIYYKSGGKPWKLSSARDGVCYIGLAFRKASNAADDATAACAAQMFLDTGDGVVFKGEFGPWYSPADRQFHLTPEAAHDLLKGVLQVYRAQGGKELREIFLHSRSQMRRDEFQGFAKACPAGVALTGVRVRIDNQEVRAFRCGTRPVVRGTTWLINNRRAYLWASGFKPRLATYDGSNIPAPLKIDVQHGEADIEQVVRDIFGLTKLNYNTCKLGYSQPVTVHFSDAVGEILVANRNVEKPRPQFKYYI